MKSKYSQNGVMCRDSSQLDVPQALIFSMNATHNINIYVHILTMEFIIIWKTGGSCDRLMAVTAPKRHGYQPTYSNRSTMMRPYSVIVQMMRLIVESECSIKFICHLYSFDP